MRTTRVHVEGQITEGDTVELPRETAAHVARVLRARAGDSLSLFCGDGREFEASVASVRGSRVTVTVGAGQAVNRETAVAITLVQCIPRGDRMDFIVQKATELGVARIVPVLSQRSVVRLDGAQTESKAVHWRAVAVSACEQCGRNRLPSIEPAQPLLDYLGGLSGTGLRLVFEPETDGRAARAASVMGAHGPGQAQIAIGPEGGFAEGELEAFRVAQFTRAGLGPRILRTETAAIAALVWLQTLLGEG